MFAAWCIAVGLLLIGVALTDTVRRQLPVSASALYLAAGVALGPQGLGLLQLSLQDDALLIERGAEVAVLVSLFAVGLRLRVRLSDRLWVAPLKLATLAMVLTTGAMWALASAFGLAPAAALLLAAVLAPTDPVLASDVQVDRPGDRDRLRFSLSGEGGLNDGTAFPFVLGALGLMGLHELGPWGLRWWTLDLLWAVSAGLLLGWALGWAFARLVVHLRRDRAQAFGMESFLTLGLIALVYGLSLALQAYGFLAVFAAGLAMRYVERTDSGAAPAGPPAQESSAYVARAVLDFALDLEKLAELAVMLLVGSLLTWGAFGLRSVALALLLFLVVRPAAVWAATTGGSLSRQQRGLASWFGIRGIGSMYYLAFAVAHGATGAAAQPVVDAVLVTIVLSVLLHGSSATPVMRHYAARRRA